MEEPVRYLPALIKRTTFFVLVVKGKVDEPETWGYPMYVAQHEYNAFDMVTKIHNFDNTFSKDIIKDGPLTEDEIHKYFYLQRASEKIILD